MPIEVKRFKLDDGREGSYAPIGDGLIKMLFDDGDMMIVTDGKSDARQPFVRRHQKLTPLRHEY